MAGMFFKLLFKALVPIVIVLGFLSYFQYLQGKDPLAMLMAPFRGSGSATITRAEPVAEIRRADASPAMQPVGEPVRDETPRTLTAVSSGATVYRWRDADGNLHFGDNPPQHVQEVETLDIDPDANLIQGDRSQQQAAAPAAGVPTADPAVPAMPYSPEQIEKLFRDAQAVKEKLEQRAQAQEDLMNRHF